VLLSSRLPGGTQKLRCSPKVDAIWKELDSSVRQSKILWSFLLLPLATFFAARQSVEASKTEIMSELWIPKAKTPDFSDN